MSPLALFQQAFLNPLQSLLQQNPGTLVLLVPHVRDLLNSHVVFPQGVGEGDFGNLPSVRNSMPSWNAHKDPCSLLGIFSPSKCFPIHACFLLTVFGLAYQLWMFSTTSRISNTFSDRNNHRMTLRVLYHQFPKT